MSVTASQVSESLPFILIAGPCQLESKAHALEMAAFLKELTEGQTGLVPVFKSSFDKANRTSLDKPRGVGLSEGMKILADVKESFGFPVLTDIHLPEQARIVSEVVDVIQIPAFLCRQTDLLVAAGETGRIVNIKKGQFLAAEDLKYAAKKVSASGNEKVMLCERGTCFGYRDLIVDYRNLLIMKQLSWPTIFDATHSAQSMGGAGGSSAGHRQFILPLIRAAVAVGCSGVYAEFHQDPPSAPSDGATMLTPDEMRRAVREIVTLLKFWEDSSCGGQIEVYEADDSNLRSRLLGVVESLKSV